MHSLCLAVLLGPCLPLSAAWPLSDDIGGNIFLAPKSSNGNFFAASSSSSSESILAPGSDGKLHSVIRELHSEEANDGHEEKRARTAVACIDGRCKQSVQQLSPETGALAPAVIESHGLPHDQQMMTMPTDMMQGFHDLSKSMMSEMTQPLPGVEYLGDAVDEDADPTPAENSADNELSTAENSEESESFSKSYSYSNVDGKTQKHVRVQRCHNGKCETVEQHGNGTPASSQPGVGAANSKVRDSPEGGILVANEASVVAGRDA
mmetsp:Transcript_109076/g.211260  ORF Transcript_109076/g.211260 Transcript_109076/m.211260 type:complete len:264 (+) Transcript_109076:138-929(+)